MIVPLLLITVGFLYSYGLKLKRRRFRLKAGYGVKNAVIGLSWSLSMMLSLKTFDFSIFSFYFLKLFVNSAIFDLKDVDRDEILTLPKLLGNHFKAFMSFLNVLAHIMALYHFHPVVISSFILTQIAILIDEKKARIIVDSEPTLSAFLCLLLQSSPSRS